jgi:hypothetical protein
LKNGQAPISAVETRLHVQSPAMGDRENSAKPVARSNGVRTSGHRSTAFGELLKGEGE